MKWLYIAVGLIMVMILLSLWQNPVMYTNKGEMVTPIHMGVENGK